MEREKEAGEVRKEENRERKGVRGEGRGKGRRKDVLSGRAAAAAAGGGVGMSQAHVSAM